LQKGKTDPGVVSLYASAAQVLEPAYRPLSPARRKTTFPSSSLGGRPQISVDLRALIRRMSVENFLWGAPRIHGELLKLGFAVAQSTVAKYMVKKGDPSGQSWGTFLRNHMPHIAAMDLFVVPTISFNLLYVLVIVRLARRSLWATY
jgi:hypothetical protein